MAVNLAALRQAAAPASGRSHASSATSNQKPVGLAALQALSKQQQAPTNAQRGPVNSAPPRGPETTSSGALQQGGFHADEAGRAVSPIQPSPSHYRAAHHDRATPVVAKRWSPSQHAAMAAAEHEAAAAAQRLRETAAAAHSARSPDASQRSPDRKNQSGSPNQQKQKSSRTTLGEPATGFRSMKWVPIAWSFAQKLPHSSCLYAAINALEWTVQHQQHPP